MNYWIKPALDIKPPFATVYRVKFELDNPTAIQFDFSADEHCEIFIDGQRIIDGPERGDAGYWYLQHYTGILDSGKHVLTARVLCFGQDFTAYAQMSVMHGFYLKVSGPLSGILDTATGDWQCQQMTGVSFHKPYPDWGVFPRVEIGSSYNWDILDGCGGEWMPVKYFTDERILHAPDLPPMRYELETGYRIFYHAKRILVVFDDYVCVWPEFIFSGSGTMRVRWAETLYENTDFDSIHLKGNKGNRDNFDNKYFIGEGNDFILSGGHRRWVDYWWKAGRYLEIVYSGDCKVEKMTFHRTGYPYKLEWQAKCSLPELNRLLPLAYRTLEQCSHETYMDCPYYEQLMYIGDARLEALSGFAISSDDRLTIKSMRMLARSQQDDGMIFSRWPAKADQIIPSFSMIYVFALYDLARWRNHPEVIIELLPTARRIVAYLLEHLEDGLLQMPGWNFVDWVDGWINGVTSGNCTLNWFAVLTLEKMAELEQYAGNHEQGAAYIQQAALMARTVQDYYFNAEQGLFADDLEQQHFSEHAQVIALLTNQISPPIAAGLLSGLQRRDLAPTSIYFSYYYLEACYKWRNARLFFSRLAKWDNMESSGLKTLPEEFANPRSDCHAWSSHPLYHYYASVLGIRSAEFGCMKLDISPLLGELDYAEGAMAHPMGKVYVRLQRFTDHIEIKYCVPATLSLTVNMQKADTPEGIVRIPIGCGEGSNFHETLATVT